MNRLDALAQGFADGTLAPAEEAELDGLLADPAAEARFRSFLVLEHGLRAGRRLPDFAPAIEARLRERGVERVMTTLRFRRRPGRARIWAAAVLFMAVVLSPMFEAGGVPVARILDGVRAGDLVRTDEPLRTGGSALHLAYLDEETFIRVEPGSELVLREVSCVKEVELRRGQMDADVAPQFAGAMIIRAPHARLEVLGTRLSLVTSPEGTRLDVEEGLVRMTRSRDGASVEVPARHYSVASAEGELGCIPAPDVIPAPTVLGFSLVSLDGPRGVIPGFEDVCDGAIIPLAKLPTRRINFRANVSPERVRSVRFLDAGGNVLHTDLVWPYTIVPHDGHKGPGWQISPGTYTVTAQPFGGAPRSVTFTLLGGR